MLWIWRVAAEIGVSGTGTLDVFGVRRFLKNPAWRESALGRLGGFSGAPGSRNEKIKGEERWKKI